MYHVRLFMCLLCFVTAFIEQSLSVLKVLTLFSLCNIAGKFKVKRCCVLVVKVSGAACCLLVFRLDVKFFEEKRKMDLYGYRENKKA